MQYRDAVQVLMVCAYNHTVKFFTPGRVHKGHLMVLGLLFLEATYYFGSEFCKECFTGEKKKCWKHDPSVVRKSGTGCRMAMEELLKTKKGVAGRFYMDMDILSRLYKDMAE